MDFVEIRGEGTDWLPVTCVLIIQEGSDSDQQSDSDKQSDIESSTTDSRKRIDLILDKKIELGQVWCSTDLYLLPIGALFGRRLIFVFVFFVCRQMFYFCKLKGKSYQNAEWISADDLCSQYDVLLFSFVNTFWQNKWFPVFLFDLISASSESRNFCKRKHACYFPKTANSIQRIWSLTELLPTGTNF